MKVRLMLFLFPILLLVPRGNASALSCDGGIVSAGDPVVDLIVKCGQPDAKESHQEVITGRIDDGIQHRTYVTVEEWTYNYGPQQFMRIVTIKNGRIAGIRTGNYGYSKESKPDQRECGDRIISIGDTKTDVLAKCGEPFFKDTHEEELREKVGDVDRKIFVAVEEWTYNFGPQRFMRIIKFRNGRVVDIRTGGYGTR